MNSVATPISIDLVNQMNESDFITLLGGIYEHSPWVAAAAWQSVPFANLDALKSTMKSVVQNAPLEAKVELLKAHPEFAGKEAKSGNLTKESTAEQARLSLSELPRDQLIQMQQINRTYMERFGFPGIVAVRLQNSVEDVFEILDKRVENEFEEEVTAAIGQVFHIASFRLDDLLCD